MHELDTLNLIQKISNKEHLFPTLSGTLRKSMMSRYPVKEMERKLINKQIAIWYLC